MQKLLVLLHEATVDIATPMFAHKSGVVSSLRVKEAGSVHVTN